MSSDFLPTLPPVPASLYTRSFGKKIEIKILWKVFYMAPRAYGIPIDGLQFRAAVDTGVV